MFSHSSVKPALQPQRNCDKCGRSCLPRELYTADDGHMRVCAYCFYVMRGQTDHHVVPQSPQASEGTSDLGSGPLTAQVISPSIHCACGANYTREQWLTLRRLGIQRVAEMPDLELRDCSACGSTISVEVRS